jgi:hypothetical protein
MARRDNLRLYECLGASEAMFVLLTLADLVSLARTLAAEQLAQQQVQDACPASQALDDLVARYIAQDRVRRIMQRIESEEAARDTSKLRGQ